MKIATGNGMASGRKHSSKSVGVLKSKNVSSICLRVVLDDLEGYEPCDLKWNGSWDQGSCGPGNREWPVHRTRRDMVY